MNCYGIKDRDNKGDNNGNYAYNLLFDLVKIVQGRIQGRVSPIPLLSGKNIVHVRV